jgi:hypothetical protein
MRCPSGILGTKIMFVVVNVVVILTWARQIREDVSRERIEAVREEVKWWDGEIERLDGLLVEVCSTFSFF